MKAIPELPLSIDHCASTNGFTLGKEYPIEDSNGNTATVLNDNGHERVIMLDGSLSAHLLDANHDPVGYFRIVAHTSINSD